VIKCNSSAVRKVVTALADEGGGYNRPQQRPQQRPAPQQRPQQQRPAQAQQNDDFGEGPITDGMEDDNIPF